MPVNETVTITYTASSDVFNFDFASSGDTGVAAEDATFTATAANANHYIASSSLGRQEVMFDLAQATPTSIAAIEALRSDHITQNTTLHIVATTTTSSVHADTLRSAIVASANTDITTKATNSATFATLDCETGATATDLDSSAIIAANNCDYTKDFDDGLIIGCTDTNNTSTKFEGVMMGLAIGVMSDARNSIMMGGKNTTALAQRVVFINAAENDSNKTSNNVNKQQFIRSENGEAHYVNVDANATDYYTVDSTGFHLFGATAAFSYEPQGVVTISGSGHSLTPTSSVIVIDVTGADQSSGELGYPPHDGAIIHIINTSSSYSWTIGSQASAVVPADSAIRLVWRLGSVFWFQC